MEVSETVEKEEILLSAREYERLVEELKYLTGDRRREVAEKIRKARSYGDLAENSEYDAAKEEQAKLESRIAQRKSLMRRARVLQPEDIDTRRVNVGSQVTIIDEDEGSEYTYTIVGAMDSDPSRNRISYRSPVGKALYGRKVGESVGVRLPGGLVHYRIESIEWVGGSGASEGE
jgi:transcription elongation factor GreA